ncbi:unnamed protein product [Ixodes pacificus]
MSIAISVPSNLRTGGPKRVLPRSLWTVTVLKSFLANISLFGTLYAVNLSIILIFTDLLQLYCSSCLFQDRAIIFHRRQASTPHVDGGCEDVRLFLRCAGNKISLCKKCLYKETSHRKFGSAHQEWRGQ